MHHCAIDSLLISITRRKASLPPDAGGECLLTHSMLFFEKHWPDSEKSMRPLPEPHAACSLPFSLCHCPLSLLLLSLNYNTYIDDSQNNKRWLKIHIVFADHIPNENFKNHINQGVRWDGLPENLGFLLGIDTHTHTRTYTHTQIHTHIHTYTCTHTRTLAHCYNAGSDGHVGRHSSSNVCWSRKLAARFSFFSHAKYAWMTSPSGKPRAFNCNDNTFGMSTVTSEMSDV